MQNIYKQSNFRISMALIELFDGTEKSELGRALIPAFAEMAKYLKMQVRPQPGSLDLARYALVKKAEEEAYNSSRDQVNYRILLESVLNSPQVNAAGKYTFTLSESDFYADELSWCFGGVIPDSKGGRHLVMSTYRLPDLDTLAHVATHELGHMFGAASPGRRNTEENLGSHCTNLCIMQQKLSVQEMSRHYRQLAGKQNKFCSQCGDELKQYASR